MISLSVFIRVVVLYLIVRVLKKHRSFFSLILFFLSIGLLTVSYVSNLSVKCKF